jgi:DNA modification methylase
MWSNPGDTVLTPFMGVGSEICGAIINGRRGVGIELKSTYYRQALKNIAAASTTKSDAKMMFAIADHAGETDAVEVDAEDAA